jgi:serine/threonine protein kinase
MGQVYRARDTRLGRDVALKALPDAVADDPERLARFEREGRLLASLNHPNLAVLYAIERDRDRPYLAIELIEGESLAERLTRGPLPLAEACEVSAQVASGLEAAHQAGVVHRDLKPANVMVRSDGLVKILDFGLARGPDAPGAAGDLSVTHHDESGGRWCDSGRPPMSPEQAKGDPPIGAPTSGPGAASYRMPDRRRPFPGEDFSETLASILKTEPDWSALPPDTSQRLRDLQHAAFARIARTAARRQRRSSPAARRDDDFETPALSESRASSPGSGRQRCSSSRSAS